MASSKEQIVTSVDDDEDSGYGSNKDTWQQAKQVLQHSEAHQVRTRFKAMSSCAIPRPLLEIEMDLIDLGSDTLPPFYRYVSIDNFTKKAWISP